MPCERAPLAPGLRQTLPRKLVWEAVVRLRGHCTAEEIAADLEAQGLGVPRSSIYRALEALHSSGSLRAVHFGGGPARYEPAGADHQHAICRRCGAVLHLDHAVVLDLEEHLAREHGFQPLHTEVVVEGTCAACSQPADPPAGG